MYVPLLAREYLEEGKQLGLQLGMEEGEHLKALKIARKMMAQKMPISAIAEITELSENEIRDSLN